MQKIKHLVTWNSGSPWQKNFDSGQTLSKCSVNTVRLSPSACFEDLGKTCLLLFFSWRRLTQFDNNVYLRFSSNFCPCLLICEWSRTVMLCLLCAAVTQGHSVVAAHITSPIMQILVLKLSIITLKTFGLSLKLQKLINK